MLLIRDCLYNSSRNIANRAARPGGTLPMMDELRQQLAEMSLKLVAVVERL